MSPTVGELTANLLDAMADRAAELESTLPPDSKQTLPVLVRNISGYTAAAALARLIVGGE